MSHVPYYVLLRPNGEHNRYPREEGGVISVHTIDKKIATPGGHSQIAIAEEDLRGAVQIGLFHEAPAEAHANLLRAARLVDADRIGPLFSVERDGSDVVITSHQLPIRNMRTGRSIPANSSIRFPREFILSIDSGGRYRYQVTRYPAQAFHQGQRQVYKMVITQRTLQAGGSEIDAWQAMTGAYQRLPEAKRRLR